MTIEPPPADWIYWLSLVVLLLANIACWVATFFMLPGNWAIVGLAAVSAFLLPERPPDNPPEGLGVSWWAVLVLLTLAALGELVEFLAGAAGAAKEGASRRGMILSLIGAVVGSILGAIVGVPIPLIGPVIAALGGAAGGAFLGAYVGESWKGRIGEERMNISKGALIGRLLGTVGKVIIGSVMVVYITFESLLEPLFKMVF